jgi:uncharacterized YigZ family protein
MKNYYIYEKSVYQIDIMKSKFISILSPISAQDDVERILKEIKKEYPKARHYIYAYILDQKQKSNDDGEPSGTAGKPTLELLNNQNLTNCLLVTVRYFGGIKLGASRLLRTYLDSAIGAVKAAKKYVLEITDLYSVEIPIEKRFIFEEICNLNSVNVKKIIYNNDSIYYEILSNLNNISDLFNKVSLNTEFLETIENKVEV